MQTSSWQHIESITHKLNWLSACHNLDERLRRLCQHLACHWEAQLLDHALDRAFAEPAEETGTANLGKGAPQ